MYQLYTDGGCRSKGLGAWAFAVIQDNKLLSDKSGLIDETTNNRMELTAVIQGLKRFDSSTADVEVVSDSTYIVNCFLQKWYVKWRRNNWQNSNHIEVLNRDLWEELLDIVERFKKPVQWKHVKGHCGNEWNEHVDGLCAQQFNNSGIGGITRV